MAAKGGEKTEAAKPGEPPFGLKLEPDGKVLFKGKLGENITVERTITNTTPDRQCYKIKCTANDIFRVRQPLGFIEPKESVAVKISFMGKTPGESEALLRILSHEERQENGCGKESETGVDERHQASGSDQTAVSLRAYR
ncbi:hypothetical protein PFISCL1PPCAC_946, partial [Pristionchus fissidentatus]